MFLFVCVCVCVDVLHRVRQQVTMKWAIIEILRFFPFCFFQIHLFKNVWNRLFIGWCKHLVHNASLRCFQTVLNLLLNQRFFLFFILILVTDFHCALKGSPLAPPSGWHFDLSITFSFCLVPVSKCYHAKMLICDSEHCKTYTCRDMSMSVSSKEKTRNSLRSPVHATDEWISPHEWFFPEDRCSQFTDSYWLFGLKNENLEMTKLNLVSA